MCSKRQLWICGDIHGELSGLVRKATTCRISSADILVVGDFGAGFGRPKSMEVAYGKVRKALEENDICIYTIRGNHDDPAFFDGLHNFERLHFLQDHHIIELCDKRIYLIGGAVSADIDLIDPLRRKSRRMINDSLIKFGSSKRIWWSDEAPKQITETHPTAVDIVVSHEAPLSFAPTLMRANHVRDDTWKKIIESRKYLDYVLSQVKPPLWFYGHYHSHYEGEAEFTTGNGENFPHKTHYQCLDIAEMVRVI